MAGTRMRVTDILEMLASGVPEEEVLGDFPYVKLEDIRRTRRALPVPARMAGRRHS